MIIPNGDRAVVAIEKLTAYALNIGHPIGGNKARVFAAVLGLMPEHAELLRAALLEAARSAEATHRGTTPYGESWEIVFGVTGPNGQTATIISGWMIDTGNDFPRLVSCYVRV